MAASHRLGVLAPGSQLSWGEFVMTCGSTFGLWRKHAMRISGMKYMLALSCGLLAVSAYAAPVEKPFADADHVIYAPAKGAAHLPTKSNVTNHGGGVLAQARLVFIFWGPNFNNAASADYAYARALQAFRNQYGTTPEY